MENKTYGYGKEGRLINRQFKVAGELDKATERGKLRKASRLRKRLNKIGQKVNKYMDPRSEM